MPDLSSKTRIAIAGFAATAVAFGPGRMGFGLFIPEFRDAFSISSGGVGAISSLGFTGFLIALAMSYGVISRVGPVASVAAGAASACLGMGLAASAQGTGMLAAGVFFAMASAGFVWAPFNALAHTYIPDDTRPVALSLVSTGTSLGVAGAAIAALSATLSGLSWRVTWAIFAGTAFGVLLLNHLILSRLPASGHWRDPAPWRDLEQTATLPLLCVGLSFGTTTAIFISFAADRVVAAGGLAGLPPAAASGVVFLIYGMSGLVGLFTGRLRRALGLAWLLRALLFLSATSHLLLALAPGAWAATAISAGAQGIYVMTMSAVMSFWSERLFPRIPAMAFTATLLAVAVGSILGPALAGTAMDSVGDATGFLAAAGLSAATLVVTCVPALRERPVAG